MKYSALPIALALASLAQASDVKALSSPSIQIDPLQEQIGNRYIIHFQQPQYELMSAEQQQIRMQAQVNSLSQLGAEVVLTLDEINAVAAYIPESMYDMLHYDADISIEKDPLRHISSFGILQAPGFDQGDFVPFGINMVNAHLVSDENAGNQTVCVIDSGLDGRHEDFDFSRIRGQNDPGTGNWNEDTNGHGTHVAGTIAASANGLGLVGVMPNDRVNLFIVKVFGRDNWAYSSSLSYAANVCADNGATVINMSLGGKQSSQAESTTFTNLLNRGILPIAAAGNDGDASFSYPASYNSVMSVAAIDRNKRRGSFSQFNSQVEIAAPGVATWSTWPTGQGRALGGGLFVNQSQISANPMENSSGSAASGVLADCGLGTSVCQNVQGRVCLIQRGENTFAEKALNCQEGGGVGAIVYNNVAGQLNGTLGATSVSIPVEGVTQAVGSQLRNQIGQQVDFRVALGGRDYNSIQGTSMASPHVAGVAALVWSHFPGCTATEIRQVLTVTAEDLGPIGRDNEFGYGLVDAKAAYDYLAVNGCAQEPPKGLEPSPTATPTTTPTVTPSVPPSATPSVTPSVSPTSAPGCDAPQYVAGASYRLNDIVANNGKLYQCTGHAGWCSSAVYAPGDTIHWQAAWTEVGSCQPSPTTTPSPTSTPTLTPEPTVSPEPTVTVTPEPSPSVTPEPSEPMPSEPKPTGIVEPEPSPNPPVAEPPRTGSLYWLLLVLLGPVLVGRRKY